jgi:uncharacterized caspase-like protein
MRRILSVVAMVLGFVAFASAALAEKRIALVIGNGAYRSVANLPNPPRDAAAMGELFKAAGFDEVIVKTDLGVIEMKAQIRDFARRARDADIAAVYYAGHGIEIGGHNYLVPIDAKLEFDTDAEDEAVDLDRVLTQLESAKRLKLVILDACRENPFSTRIHGQTRAIGRGLAPPSHQAGGTLVAYAAEIGETAADGDGEHSPYTTALLNNLTVPGKDVRLALGKVRDEVLKATDGRQSPSITGSLGGDDLWLVPPRAAPPPEDSAEKKELKAFDAAMRADTIASIDAFLASYPDGPSAEIARRERARLAPPEDSPEKRELSAFDAAMRTDTIPALDAFLSRYPDGASAEIARRERARLAPPPAPVAAQPLEPADVAAFESAMRVDTIPAIDAFLALFPGSSSADIARRERARLASAAAIPAPAPSPTVVASLPVPDPRALAGSVEAELRRVGCYASADADWGSPQVRSALAKYARWARLETIPGEPSASLLSGLTNQRDRVCPLECGAREVAYEGRCVAKTCPSGETLSRDGVCFARPVYVPPARVFEPRREARPARERAEARPEAGRAASAGPKNHCFNFNGSQYCE